ncbi:MAG TPA: tetratricopeptide repeat protein [Gemmataceae bacterium]|nr:tetratricopeptide repeat protein [Gemmataceae bacterium]
MQTDLEIIDAISQARHGVIENPLSGLAWGKLGMVLWAHDYAEQANFCLAQAERLDARDPRWPYFQGITLLQVDPETGIECLRRAVERCTDTLMTPRLRLGEALLDAGRLDDAALQLQRALELEPANVRARCDMGRLALLRQDWRGAIERLSDCVGDERAGRQPYTMRALAYRRLGDLKHSEEDEGRALKLDKDPKWPDPFVQQALRLQRGLAARIETAVTLRRAGRLDQAIPILEDTAKKYPHSTIAWLALADLWHDLNQMDRVEEACQHVLQVDPEAPQGWYGLGCCQAVNRPREAIESFRRAIKLKPDYAVAHFNLAECLKQLGEPAGALEEYRATLRCRPDYEPARSALHELAGKSSQRNKMN